MKGAMLGVVGLGGVGAFAIAGAGSGPNDYIGIVSKSPQAVYAAFSALGPESEVSVEMPLETGAAKTLTQRLIKVPNEQVKLELAIDGEALVTAEVQLAPEGEKGTRIAAEFDFNARLMNRLMKEQGGPVIPTFAFQEALMDRVFANAMTEMAERIEEGKPLLSLGETHARWGRDDSPAGGSTEYRQAEAEFRQSMASSPAATARPQLDPNAAAKRPTASTTFDQR